MKIALSLTCVFLLITLSSVLSTYLVFKTTELEKLHKQDALLIVQGKDAHDALCVFIQDLDRRIKETEKYLREHPEGIAGIPNATIRNSIKNQKQTLKSLDSLQHC